MCTMQKYLRSQYTQYTHIHPPVDMSNYQPKWYLPTTHMQIYPHIYSILDIHMYHPLTRLIYLPKCSVPPSHPPTCHFTHPLTYIPINPYTFTHQHAVPPTHMPTSPSIHLPTCIFPPTDIRTYPFTRMSIYPSRSCLPPTHISISPTTKLFFTHLPI